jgi:hypothetical protein
MGDETKKPPLEPVGVSIRRRTGPPGGSEGGRPKPFWGDWSGRPTDTCFVLMPFDPPKLTDIYKRYVKHPIESYTILKCFRADDIYRSTQIMQDVWVKINEAKLIVADLTYKNPNVFYELGMAHAVGKQVILIAQSIEWIPFDLQGVRTIIYEDSPTGYERLSAQLLKFIEELGLS